MSTPGHNSAAYGQEMIDGADAREFWQFIDFIRCSGLPAPVRHVAIEIWLHMRPWKMHANPSAKRIADFTGLSERTVRTAFGALSKAPFFSVSKPQKGRGNTRTFRAVSFQTMTELSTALDTKMLSNLQRNDDENRANIAVFQAKKPASPAPLSIVKPAPVAVNEDGKHAGAAVLEEKTCSSFQENLQELHPKLPNRSYQERKEGSPDGLLSNTGLDEPAPEIAKRKKKTVSDLYTDDFNHFWALYPKREGKGEAAKSWHKLSMDEKRRAYSGLKKQLPVLEKKMQTDGGRYCPMPSTWINQGRFDDEPERRLTSTTSAFDRDVPDFMPRPREDVDA